MAFYFQQLCDLVGGVPPTLAVGDPVSGKSTAVECALALFNQRECTGGNNIFMSPERSHTLPRKCLRF